MGSFNNMARRRSSPSPSPRPVLPLLLLLLAAMASLPPVPAFLLAAPGGRRGLSAPAGAAPEAAGPSWCLAPSPLRSVLVRAATAAEGAGEPGPVTAAAEAGVGKEDEEDDVDPEMDAALEQTMHTVGIDWEGADDAGAPEPMVDTQTPPTQSSAPVIAADSPFAPYAAAVEPPSCHTVYYGGVHERSFWRQGREAVQVIVPVAADTPKASVRFRMESRTWLVLAVGEEVVFDREVAQPVYRDTSYWYFEEVEGVEGGKGKAVVLELDKRLGYSNWPRLFLEDPDLSRGGRQQQQQGQGEGGGGE